MTPEGPQVCLLRQGHVAVTQDGPLVEAYDRPQIVGMDLHRRRSVLVRMTEDARKPATVRIANNPGVAGR